MSTKTKEDSPIPDSDSDTDSASVSDAEVDSPGRAWMRGLLHLFHLPDRPERQWQMVRQKYENTKCGLVWALPV